MDDGGDEKRSIVDITSTTTIISIIIIIFLSLCSLFLCLRRARKSRMKKPELIISVNNPSATSCPKIQQCSHRNPCCTKEHFPEYPLSQRPQESGNQKEGRFSEEEPSYVTARCCQTGCRKDSCDICNVDLHLLKLDERSRNLLKEIIIADATWSSYVCSSEELGEDSTVFVKFCNTTKIMKKHSNCEILSISSNSLEELDKANCHTDEERLFPVESFSPMNREHKFKWEESDTSGMNLPSVLHMQPSHCGSRTFNSRSRLPTTSISESIRPVQFDSASHVAYVNGDELSTEEEDEDKLPNIRASLCQFHEVSKDSIILINMESSPQPRHKGFLVIPNSSRNSRKHQNKIRQSSKSSRLERKIKSTSEDERSKSHYLKAQAQGEQMEYRSAQKVFMKLLPKNASRSQKQSMEEKISNCNTHPSEAKLILMHAINSPLFPVEDSTCDTICLNSLPNG